MPPKDTRETAIDDAIDGSTDGGLYALSYEAKTHGWDPHVWAHKLNENMIRLFFYATDKSGRTRYFDHASVKDTGDLYETIRMRERLVEIHKGQARIHEGLARLDQGLDPVPNRVDTNKMD